MGFAVSVLIHAVLLAVLAVCVLPTPFKFAALDLLTIAESSSPKHGIDTELPEAAKISFQMAGGGERRAVIPPSRFVAPEADTGTLPTELVDSINRLALQGAGKGKTQGAGDADEGHLGAPFGGAKPGSNAVTAGPFTVWSYPNPPQPREAYYVFVRVKVPGKAKRRYSVMDLSGYIKGNDSRFGGVDWHQNIPFEKNMAYGPDLRYRQHVFRMDTRRKRFVPLPLKARNKNLPVIDGYATLAIKVPGAAVERVQDEIRVKSRLLDEEKTIKLVFKKSDEAKPAKRRRRRSVPNVPAPPAGP